MVFVLLSTLVKSREIQRAIVPAAVDVAEPLEEAGDVIVVKVSVPIAIPRGERVGYVWFVAQNYVVQEVEVQLVNDTVSVEISGVESGGSVPVVVTAREGYGEE